MPARSSARELAQAGVTVRAHQDHAPIGGCLIQQLLARAAVLEQRKIPAASDDPSILVAARADCYRVEDRLDGREVEERALQFLQTGRATCTCES